MRYGGNASSGPVYIVRNGAVAVPTDYVGMHFRAWPLFDAVHWAAAGQPFPTAPSPAPTNLQFGSYRTHDSVYAWWHKIEKTQGVYDWTSLDTQIDAHRLVGRTVTFCMFGVPDFYLSAGNPNKGGPNGPSCYPDGTSPNGLTALAAFITALITRYNTAGGGWAAKANGGGTNWSVVGKGINFFELWNEPVFGQSEGFWVGTLGQFIDTCYVMRNAVLAVDPTLPVHSPGFSALNWMQLFLQGTGTLNTGVTGLSLCDAICYHIYTTAPPGSLFGSWTNPAYEVFGGDAVLRSILKTCGAQGKEIYITETGVDYNAGTNELNIINAQAPIWRYRWWARLQMAGAALGYKKWMTYAWDTPYACFPDTDPSGIALAVSDVHTNVAGKTIKDAWYQAGGEVGLRFSDSSTFIV